MLRKSAVKGVALGALLIIFLAAFLVYRTYASNAARTGQVLAWLKDPRAHPGWQVRAGERCGDAPFLIPSGGFIGYLWDDSFRIGHRHQGIDIFGGEAMNVTPIVAAYPGYLTRLPDWKASLIIRIPDDPLQPGRQIWIYYTHLAGPDGSSFIVPDFAPGTQDVFVEAGTLLGYQGNYSGNALSPVGVHLHFSIVLDDGQGKFRNELEIENTLDPSPYLGLSLDAQHNPGIPPVCNPP